MSTSRSAPHPVAVRSFDRQSVAPPRLFQPPALTGAPLDLEIGCGVGWHPISYAERNPERELIAIEHTRAKFESFRRRTRRHALTNLIPVHADAVRYVTHALANDTVERIFLLYPNPEPHAPNKRWFRMPFMEELLAKLKRGGTIELATNIRAYAEEAKIYAVRHWTLELIGETRPRTPRTHFEKKYLERGETCFDLIFQKP